MTRYVCVKETPTAVGKDEYVIATPNFVSDVDECRTRPPATYEMSTNYLHSLINYIGHKYDPEFRGSGCVVVNEYKGMPFRSSNDIAAIVCRAIRKYYPSLFASYIEHNIKNRPFGTKLIYFVGDHLDTEPFVRLGVENIDEKDVDVYMGRKDKKPNKGNFKKVENEPVV